MRHSLAAQLNTTHTHVLSSSIESRSNVVTTTKDTLSEMRAAFARAGHHQENPNVLTSYISALRKAIEVTRDTQYIIELRTVFAQAGRHQEHPNVLISYISALGQAIEVTRDTQYITELRTVFAQKGQNQIYPDVIYSYMTAMVATVEEEDFNGFVKPIEEKINKEILSHRSTRVLRTLKNYNTFFRYNPYDSERPITLSHDIQKKHRST